MFDLSDARIKLDRACKHISDLEAAIIALEASDLYSITFEQNKGLGSAELKFQSLHQMDKSINALIGDAVGNLRSALDYLFFPIAVRCGADPTKVTFPFASDKKGFSGEVRSPNRQLTDELIVIFDGIEAYQGGAGHSLWAINKLRNIDKHRLLIAVANLAGIIVSFKVGPVTVTEFRTNIVAGQDCVAIKSIALGEVQLTEQPRPTFKIQIEEVAEGINSEALALLHGGARDIDSLLKALEQL
ncbi:hypothetical protein CAP39_12075 [Sphingomonas sp. IBVSS1]|nr:hypothetical protein CAP39_12075 [Sphingomonas sp. IBVSS1]